MKEQEEIFRALQAKTEVKQRGLYENFLRLVEKDRSVECPLPNSAGRRRGAAASQNLAQPDAEIGAQGTLDHLRKSTVQAQSLKEHHFVKCYESIQFSGFNPVPASRKLLGDLFYLTVKTLDVGERGITCCINGFYVNNSIEKSNFNP